MFIHLFVFCWSSRTTVLLLCYSIARCSFRGGINAGVMLSLGIILVYCSIDRSKCLWPWRYKGVGFNSIYGRLMRADLVKCWKIFQSIGDVGLLNFFSMVVDRRTREHSLKNFLSRCELELKRFFHVPSDSEMECVCSHAGISIVI